MDINILNDHIHPTMDMEISITRAPLGAEGVKSRCKMMQHLNGHNHTKPQLDWNSQFL
jgi:hypothetical protein